MFNYKRMIFGPKNTFLAKKRFWTTKATLKRWFILCEIFLKKHMNITIIMICFVETLYNTFVKIRIFLVSGLLSRRAPVGCDLGTTIVTNDNRLHLSLGLDLMFTFRTNSIKSQTYCISYFQFIYLFPRLYFEILEFNNDLEVSLVNLPTKSVETITDLMFEGNCFKAKFLIPR
jgi:hypothetical protein